MNRASEENENGVDVETALKNTPVVVMPIQKCGVCDATNGDMQKMDIPCRVFTRTGVSPGVIFNFQCHNHECGAKSGVTTCTLRGRRVNAITKHLCMY